MTKPYSQACENNKNPILKVISRVFSQQKQVLEVGSGTGQHAIYFAQNLPFLTWQTSDLLSNHEGINRWIDEYPSPNLLRPLALNLYEVPLFANQRDAIYTANTLHIISWQLVQAFFKLVESHLAKNGVLCIYGPFNYDGQYTSASNQSFDLLLKSRDEHSGIRDIEAVLDIAIKAGLSLQEDIAMPANNRMLVFQKI